VVILPPTFLTILLIKIQISKSKKTTLLLLLVSFPLKIKKLLVKLKTITLPTPKYPNLDPLLLISAILSPATESWKNLFSTKNKPFLLSSKKLIFSTPTLPNLLIQFNSTIPAPTNSSGISPLPLCMNKITPKSNTSA